MFPSSGALSGPGTVPESLLSLSLVHHSDPPASSLWRPPEHPRPAPQASSSRSTLLFFFWTDSHGSMSAAHRLLGMASLLSWAVRCRPHHSKKARSSCSLSCQPLKEATTFQGETGRAQAPRGCAKRHTVPLVQIYQLLLHAPSPQRLKTSAREPGQEHMPLDLHSLPIIILLSI